MSTFSVNDISNGRLLAADSFPPTASSVHLARELTEERLGALGFERCAEVALVVSELVTNAVMHANSVVDFELSRDAGSIGISVTDFGPGIPALREAGESSGGYGLRVVEMVASAWGYELLTPFGKRVWALVSA